MTRTAWRLVKTRHLRHAFDGEGARLYGGRWSSPGVRVVYVAESLALAAMEVLVHLGGSAILAAYSAVRVDFDSALVTVVDRSSLPRDWRRSPAPASLATIGDRWVAGGASAVIEVPSAVVEGERNFLLNPRHADFGSIAFGEPRPFVFDERLLRRRP